MYDDVSYYSFVPSAQPHEKKAPTAKHRRKASLLENPTEGAQANKSLIDGTQAIEKGTLDNKGPPTATLSRRAQSYTDFHHAARAVLLSDSQSHEQGGHGHDKEIKNDLDFSRWYQDVEQSLLEASHDHAQAYLDQLKYSHSYLDSLSSSTTSTLNLLASLSKSFKDVDAQTTTFRRQCESLMTEQERLTRLANDVGNNLQYYSYLEPITKRLNAPGAGNFVRGKDFSTMLERLDECLDYMTAHPSQREAHTYRSRYRALLTRGLTLIRVHFVSALRAISQDVTRRIADRQLNDTTMSALLYAKFRVGASELKQVAQEIRKRAILPTSAESDAEVEYQGLMNELYTSYSTTRGKLVIPLVRKKIAEIAMTPSTSKDLLAFARSSIGYIKGICSDEYGLWREWFEGEGGLYYFLEGVCEPLYDHLRPRIIHENQLPKLCELCTLLQTRYMGEQDEDIEAIAVDQLDFSMLIQSALEDTQTRLVFRTQTILRDQIENYRPKPDDLNYLWNNPSLAGIKQNEPVTSGRKSSLVEPRIPMSKDPIASDGGDVSNGLHGFGAEVVSLGWYPTLRKAIWLLSRIYRLVNSTVFDDLAHQIVHQTTLSLDRATTMIASKSTLVDSQLFLLKHLLILKQQIVAFDIEYVTSDISFDFSGVTSTFYELRERGGLFDPRNLWRFIGGGLLPRVIENMLDAKAELDGRLRTVINEYTTGLADRITNPISDSATRMRGFEVASAIGQIQKVANHEVPLLREKLGEYLEDARTKDTLVGAVQDQVVQNYESFYEQVMSEKRAKGKGISTNGKGKEDDVWDVDTFSEWTGEVFRSRRLGLSDENGEVESRSRSLSRSGSV